MVGMVFSDLSSHSTSQDFEFHAQDMENLSTCKGKGSDSCDVTEENTDGIDLNARLNEDNQESKLSSALCSGKDMEITSSEPSKVWARGHWKLAEDTKLKELVAFYGPQNWNLIAEKLEGRSGLIILMLKIFFSFVCDPFFSVFFYLALWCLYDRKGKAAG